jgi:hypothetical protein
MVRGSIGCERQSKLRALQRLALALLVAVKHEGFGRRIEIEPDHDPEFGLEIGINGKLEDPGDVRF